MSQLVWSRLLPRAPRWRNGRRVGLKNRCPQGRAGSTPALGTIDMASGTATKLRQLALHRGGARLKRRLWVRLTAWAVVILVSVTACGRTAIGIGPASAARSSSPTAQSQSPSPACQSPAARNYSALAYDSDRGQVVLFGGWGADAYGDTWLSTASSCWQHVSTTSSPSPRWSPAAAFDPDRHQTILYGGRTFPDTWLDDTWTWDGNSWTQIQLTPHPSLLFPVGAYDPAIQRFVVYGVTVSGESETWVWDGTAWQRVAVAMAPQARFSSAVAYDPSSRTVILFGGRTDLGFLGDTWSFNGGNWKQLKADNSPSARGGHLMASVTQGVLLLGNDTWMWEGSTWQPINAPHSLPATTATPGITSKNGAALLIVYRSSNAPAETFLFSQGDWTAV